MSLRPTSRTRSELLARLSSEIFDVAVVGGGIHGALVAREALLRGYTVLLLEAEDYAFGASSRSSKLLHGGLRYLEQGNFSLVREALREREVMLQTAPHLSRPLRFLFPILPKLTRPVWQAHIGLSIYDLLAGMRNSALLPRYETLPPDHEHSQKLLAYGLKAKRLFSYSDAQMDDARLVVEAVVDCLDLGAVCLNHAPLKSAVRDSLQKCWNLEVQSGSSTARTRAKFVVNAAGSWVPEVHKLFGLWPEDWPSAQFSRGAHLIFKQPWTAPGLILPARDKGRVYFVLPYFNDGGDYTLVGTTDDSVAENENNPKTNREEEDELLGYLERDLPNAGLNRDRLQQSFCGVRILAAAPGTGAMKTSKLSRSEELLTQSSYLAILGGKYTTSRRVAERVLDELRQTLSPSGAPTGQPSDQRRFPGAKDWSEQRRLELKDRLIFELLRKHPSNETETVAMIEQRVESLLRRFGLRAELFLHSSFQSGFTIESSTQRALRCEIQYAIRFEQAGTAEDVLMRRLCLVEPDQKVLQILKEELEFSASSAN